MNLFFKSYKIYLIFFLIIALKGSDLLGNSQDSIHYLYPRILKYELPNKYINTPNTSFYKSDDGVLFVGKENGVLIIDGTSNYFSAMAGPVYITSTKSGRIEYLSSNDFGVLDYTPNSGVIRKSHIHDVPSYHSSFFPYNILSQDSSIFMATSEAVFVYNQNKYSWFFYNRQACKLYKTAHSVFLDIENEGLSIWRDSIFVPVIESSVLNYGHVATIFESDSLFKILTIEGISFICDKSFANITQMKDCEIKNQNIVHLESLPNDYCLTITEGNVVFIFSEEGKLVHTPHESGFLPNSPILSVLTDEFNDIWLLYEFGLYKFEYPSNTNTLRLPESIAGKVLRTLVSDKHIYLGTADGLAIFETIENDQWIWKTSSLSPGVYINLMEKYGDVVFASGKNSLLVIEGGHISRIAEGNISCLAPSSSSSVYICREEGLIRYEKENGKWVSTIIEHSFSYAQDMLFYKDRLWVICEGNTIAFYDQENETFNELEKLDGVADQLILIDDQVFLHGGNKLWVWNEDSKSFIDPVNAELSHLLLNSEIVFNESNYLFICEDYGLSGALLHRYDLKNGTTPIFEVSSSENIDQIININENGGLLWISAEDHLTRIDLNFKSNASLNTVRIEKACRYSPDFECTIIKQNELLAFSKDAISFILDNTRFQTNPDPYFRYKFTHYQKEWSDWSQKKEIRFNGLTERKYTFLAQSRSPNGEISNTVEFQFKIKAPIYRSWYAYLIYGIVLILTIFLIIKLRLLSFRRVESRVEAEIKDKMDNLIREKEKADKLVSDMFPKGTAEELKSGGRAKSEKYELATVLFSDIQGFTKIAEEMNPEVLIDELDKFFFHFDSVVEKYNIEKIKTIGDAYMAAGGIPVKNSTNPVEVVLAGLEMQQYMNDLKKSKTDIWDLRIGIHTGPVISGVVGHKKLSYDIWGDTVNTASRMESSGEGGKVNISGMTYSLVKDYFICEYRGKLPVKYKGNIDMYFVTGLRPELSVDLQGLPNRRFFLKVQLLRMRDLEDRVFNQLLNEHPGTYHFHTRDHLHHIYDQAELICRAENISEEDTLLTLSASLLLYAGLTESYEHFENRSAEIAREILPEYLYTEKQIDAICNLILATKVPYEPQNKLEAILIDAKMEYIGRPDFSKMIKLLYLELKSNEREKSMKKLIREYVDLLKTFKYFTVAGQRLREVSGDEQIALLDTDQ
ncbi:adenylate/guanylate cyclase domain-containing protein [Bacteroidota bacterium]